MINAINSNLISALWAQAESIVPALWLCTSLCWFFCITSFHLPLSWTPGFSAEVTRCGFADGTGWKRWNPASLEMNSGRVWSHPKSACFPLFHPSTFLHKRNQICSLFTVYQFVFVKISPSYVLSSNLHTIPPVRGRNDPFRRDQASPVTFY